MTSYLASSHLNCYSLNEPVYLFESGALLFSMCLSKITPHNHVTSCRAVSRRFFLRTFWYVLVGLTGRAQDICVVRVSFQLSSELLFTAVYPRTGGVSGNCSRNLPKPILKLSRAFSCETSDGNMFQS